MITATGWTHEHVDRLAVPDLFALIGYWKATPPAHVSLARLARAILGEKATDAPTVPTEGDLAGLAQMFG